MGYVRLLPERDPAIRGVPPPGLTTVQARGAPTSPRWRSALNHVPAALAQLVWDERRSAELVELGHDPTAAARVVRVDRGHASLRAARCEVRLATDMQARSRRLGRHRRRLPYRDLLERRTLLERRMPEDSSSSPVVAANVDIVVVANALDHPFSPRRLERFLLVAWESGATPLVVLTKADAHPDLAAAVAEAEASALGAPVLALSVRTGLGLDELRARLAGSTAVLLGRSGAGKSTLVNALVGADVAATAEVRRDGKGRHTTTHRELHLLAGGGVLIDTPGLRGVLPHDMGAGRRACVRRHRGARRDVSLRRLRPRRRARLRRGGGGRRRRAVARAVRGLAAGRARSPLVRPALGPGRTERAAATPSLAQPLPARGAQEALDVTVPDLRPRATLLTWPSPTETSATPRAPPRATSCSRPIRRTRRRRTVWTSPPRSRSRPPTRRRPGRTRTRLRSSYTLSRTASIAPGSSSVERSPGSSPSTVARTARRRILALRVFGSDVVKRISAGAKALPELLRAAGAQARCAAPRPARCPARSTQKHQTTSPLTSCGHADRAGLGHGRVADQGRLVLGRADALARDVERVVGAAVQEPVAVGVDRGPVAVRPDAREAPPVGVEVALGVAPDAARHAGPRLRADELADLAAQRAARRVVDVHRHAEQRPSERAGLVRQVRRRAEEAGRDLGAARDVHDRPRPAADALEEPQPGLGVPGLAGRAEQPQGGEVDACRRARRPPAAARARASARRPGRSGGGARRVARCGPASG